MLALWVLTLLTALAAVGFVGCVALFFRRCPLLRPGRAVPTGSPLISVVVPARNEAAHIERCVRSVLAQDYPNLEVIAVDDSSTDATPQILAGLAAEDSRLRVVWNHWLPSGWTGKCHAVYQGACRARGDWLLFVDADVLLQPAALSAAYVAARQHGAALLSLWARQDLQSFWERVVQPVIIAMNQVVDPLQRGNNPRFPTVATANGQFILVDRASYEQVGGHAKVRDAVLEDQELARRFKYAGYHTMMMDGVLVLRTRMYTSLQGIWEGWSKNNFLSLGRNLAVVCGVMLSIYFVAVSPFVLAMIGLLGLPWNVQLRDLFLANLLSSLVVLAARRRAHAHFETPLRYYLLHWLGGLVFVGIVMNSAYCHMRKRGVTWKGRRYGGASQLP